MLATPFEAIRYVKITVTNKFDERDWRIEKAIIMITSVKGKLCKLHPCCVFQELTACVVRRRRGHRTLGIGGKEVLATSISYASMAQSST